jgi:hypothetical protein
MAQRGAEVNNSTLYDIRVLVHGSSNAITVEQVTAEKAYEVAQNMGAAWGRLLPEPMRDRQAWIAKLDEEGLFAVDDASIVVKVKRSASDLS